MLPLLGLVLISLVIGLQVAMGYVAAPILFMDLDRVLAGQLGKCSIGLSWPVSLSSWRWRYCRSVSGYGECCFWLQERNWRSWRG